MINLIKPNININFMSYKRMLMIISTIILISSLIPIVIKGGLNYGIDFSGGILVQIKSKDPVKPIIIKESLKSIGIEDCTIQSFGHIENYEFLIRSQTYKLPIDGLGDKIIKVFENTFNKNKFEIRRIETVGPKAGKDLRKKAFAAIYFSLLLMTIYISGRFETKWLLSIIIAGILTIISLTEYWLLTNFFFLNETLIFIILTILCTSITTLACWIFKLRYATGAILSLIHDILITIGLYTMLNKEFNLSTVAAILTIIGYSINDTIIIYDRIRENLIKNINQNKKLETIVNDSINQTLSRTILTVSTVLLVLIALFCLGGSVIEDFSLALLIGTLVGTYSSIYVASSILVIFPNNKLTPFIQKFNQNERKKILQNYKL